MREAEPRTGEYKSWARVCGQDNGDSAAVELGWKEKHMSGNKRPGNRHKHKKAPEPF